MIIITRKDCFKDRFGFLMSIQVDGHLPGPCLRVIAKRTRIKSIPSVVINEILLKGVLIIRRTGDIMKLRSLEHTLIKT